MEKMDRERQEIAVAAGVRPDTLEDWMRLGYGLEDESFSSLFMNNPAYTRITAPTSMATRYIHEDIPTGLLPIRELGHSLGVNTPLMDCFLELARQIYDTDFMT